MLGSEGAGVIMGWRTGLCNSVESCVLLSCRGQKGSGRLVCLKCNFATNKSPSLYGKITCWRWRHSNKPFLLQQYLLALISCLLLHSSAVTSYLSTGMFSPEKTFWGITQHFSTKLRLPILHCCLSPVNTFSTALLFIFLLLTWWILKIRVFCTEVTFETVCMTHLKWWCAIWKNFS